MKYAPLTPERFIEKMKTGEYETLTGARRAIGKATWSDGQRDKARKAADAHFGEEGAAPKSPKPAKVAKGPKPATAKKAAGAAPKAAATKKAKGPKARTAATPSDAPIFTPPAEAPVTAAVKEAHAVKSFTVSDIRKNPFQTMQLAEHAVQTGTNVLNALTEARRQYPEINTGAANEQAIRTISSALRLTANVVDNLMAGMSVPEATKEVVTRPVNGATVPAESVTPGQPAYVAPTASA